MQEWGEFLDNRNQLNDKMARAGWDYNDPATFLEFYASWSPDNDSGWSSTTYDQYLKEARRESNAQLRNQLYAKAEKLLIDQMAMLPLHYYELDTLQNPNLKGMQVDYMGTVDFSRA